MFQGGSSNCHILEKLCRVTTIMASLIQDKIPWMGESDGAAYEKPRQAELWFGWYVARWGFLARKKAWNRNFRKANRTIGKDSSASMDPQFQWRRESSWVWKQRSRVEGTCVYRIWILLCKLWKTFRDFWHF